MTITPKERINLCFCGIPPPVPQKFITLFSISKKRDIVKYARDLKLTGGDFSDLIHGCNRIGYRHEPRYHDFIPSPLKVQTDDLRKALETGYPDGMKELRKRIRAIFNQRQLLAAHIFVNQEGRWHLFYYSHIDTDKSPGNHWEYGTHMHFVNYLWPNLDIKRIWEMFSYEGWADIAKSTHIKFTLEGD